MHVDFLKKILISKAEYWVVAKKNEYSSFGKTERGEDDIVFIGIPMNVKTGILYEEIKLIDLRKFKKQLH